MFGHRVFLHIGELPDMNIGGLLKKSYELLNCDYSFAQGIDQNGKAQTEVRGGAISMSLPNLPEKEIISWMLRPVNSKNGSLVLCDSNNTPLSKLFFKNAKCISMDINYMQRGAGYLSTQIVIQAEQIIFGSTTFSNRWTNYK